jgi:hydrogenase expression/formation protein HypC
VCLAIPGRVMSVQVRGGIPVAQVDFRGARQEVCVEYVPEVRPGEWVLVHLGMAIQHLDEDTAREHLALLEEAGVLEPPDASGAAIR